MDSGMPSSAIKDPKTIDLDDPAEVEAWCALLKLSADDLKAAVAIIGPMSAEVAVYVNSRGRRGVFRQVGEIGRPFELRDETKTSENDAHNGN